MCSRKTRCARRARKRPRRCSLAVLNSGGETDDARAIFDRYADFDIGIMRQAWGVKLEIRNAPGQAFVDGEMIRGVKEHLFAVLRDIVYTHNEIVARFERVSRERGDAPAVVEEGRVADDHRIPGLVARHDLERAARLAVERRQPLVHGTRSLECPGIECGSRSLLPGRCRARP